jgi:hypothetical protein
VRLTSIDVSVTGVNITKISPTRNLFHNYISQHASRVEAVFPNLQQTKPTLLRGRIIYIKFLNIVEHKGKFCLAVQVRIQFT